MNRIRYSIWGILFLGLVLQSTAIAQTNLRITNANVQDVLTYNYAPGAYQATQVIDNPDTIAALLQSRISADSIRSFLEKLTTFGSRNSGSDTVSNTFGIGAARRWAHAQFERFSQANDNRLQVGYLEFDRLMCTTLRHRNVVAVLPGTDLGARGYVLLEAHLDSRCAALCDSLCSAQGADDNGSGCALVLELARVMSAFSYHRNIVFMLTIGEEQGLYGAEAMADYSTLDSIPVKAVLNNDVVGGILCGNTSSAPSCPGAGNIDSLNLRLFSSGGFNSPHKQLARYNKLQYKEMLRPLVPVPMTLRIMTPEDRAGRGGDHIPFRQAHYTAMRFTSANEHGNASNGPGYTDHQHTSADSLGADTDHDGHIDSLWVDFNYLARNTAINGTAASMIALCPETPTFTVQAYTSTAAIITLTSQLQYGRYRVGIRTTTNDWDSVYTIIGPVDTIYGLASGQTIIFSVASMDAHNVESLFSEELFLIPTGLEAPSSIRMLSNHPNPFDEATMITVFVDAPMNNETAHIVVTDLLGKEIERLPISMHVGLNEVTFRHGYHATGIYLYRLVVEDKTLASGKMVME